MRLPGLLGAGALKTLGLLALAWIGSTLIATAPPNYDSAWYMVATARVLDGARFGSDIIETNPPLFLLFTAAPTLLARVFGADAYTVFCFFVGGLIAVSALFSARSMARAGLSCQLQIVFAAGLVVLQTLVAGLSYGQREAVMLALALPFILNEAVRLTTDATAPRAESMTWAGAAAIGFLIKPFFAVVPAGLILARGCKERRIAALFAPPYLLMLALAIAYAGLVLWLAPDWVDLLPDIASVYPAGYNPPRRWLAIAFAPEIGFGLLAIACVWIMGGRFRNLAFVLIAAGALFYLSSLIQLKGWPNHMLPGRLMLCIGLFISALGLEAPRRTGLAAAGAAAVLVLALMAHGIAGAGVFRRDDIRDSAGAAVAARAGDGAFLVISPAIQSAFPLVMELRTEWGSRNGHQWIGVGARAKLRSSDPAEREEGARLAALAGRLMREDIEHWRPRVIAVTRPESDEGWGIDWLSLYRADPGFAETWRRYCYSFGTASWDVYEQCAPAHPMEASR